MQTIARNDAPLCVGSGQDLWRMIVRLRRELAAARKGLSTQEEVIQRLRRDTASELQSRFVRCSHLITHSLIDHLLLDFYCTVYV